MTSNDFRRLALSFPETSERAHMGHPDFRVGGKIFAALGYPDDDWAMGKLTSAARAFSAATEAGANKYIQKPRTLDALREKASPARLSQDMNPFTEDTNPTTPPLTPPAPCPNFFHTVSGSRKLPPTPKLFRFGGTSCH